MPLSVASDLGLHCLPISHKKDARLMWVNFSQKSNYYSHHKCKEQCYGFELEIQYRYL